MNVSVVGFDADDTLWHSENHFAVTEEKFCELVQPWVGPEVLSETLLKRERANLEIFGYGVKGFTLSMIETAVEVSNGLVPAAAIQQLIDWGKELMTHPVELLAGARETVERLVESHRLVLITKGDLFHQESKVAESGLAEYFERVEILSEKSPESYAGVLERLGASPDQFVMVGNSVRSDILPVVTLGGAAVHIPYGITWGHESVELSDDQITWAQIEHLGELPALIGGLDNQSRWGWINRSVQ